MLQPFWAIWVEKMGFFASRIAVTLFLTLWICRTQGQHGGMENQSKLHSPIFSYLRFSSSAFVRSRTTLVSDSSRNTWHTLACTFQKCFLVKINEKSLLLSCSFHCTRIVGFFLSFLLAFARPTTMKALLYSRVPSSLTEMMFLHLKRSYWSPMLGESIRLVWLSERMVKAKVHFFEFVLWSRSWCSEPGIIEVFDLISWYRTCRVA